MGSGRGWLFTEAGAQLLKFVTERHVTEPLTPHYWSLTRTAGTENPEIPAGARVDRSRPSDPLSCGTPASLPSP